MPSAPSIREKRELGLLRSRGKREEAGRFVAEGVRVVEDLLRSPLPVEWALASSALEDTERGQALLADLEARGVPVRLSDEREFSKLAHTETPQGILAVAAIPRWSLSELNDAAVVLVLDAVQDPGNFGTLVRSAEALGAGGVVMLPGTVDPWNPKSVRASVGSSFRLPLVAAKWDAARDALRAAGFRLLAAAVGGEPVNPGPRTALIVGNEGSGISPRVLADADATVGIPLRGRAESLNVTAAAAILLHEITR